MDMVTVSYKTTLPEGLASFLSGLRSTQRICPPDATITQLKRVSFIVTSSEPFVPPGWDLVVEWQEERP